MPGCLREDELERYLAQELTATQVAEVEAHLKACRHCADRNEALACDEEGLLDRLRRLGVKRIEDLASASLAAEPATPTDGESPVESGDPGSSSPAAVTIEGYETLEELHRGGQGVVYRAIQKHTNRAVAVKVLLEGPYASPAAKRRFEREIELAAQLKHPNIVTIFHSGLTPDRRQYCVMDYVHGRRLDEHVHDRGLALEEVLALFATICDAVMYAHQRGIIHRDLKPSNILVDDSGAPKILDFGLAKQMSGPADTFASLSGQVFGTLPYMSPEQTGGNPDEIDTRSDIYSLGVLLYQLLTGLFPYPVHDQVADVIRHITQTPPTPPSRAWSSRIGVAPRGMRLKSPGRCPIDADVEVIVLKALEKEPGRRYQSAAALADDIRHYLTGEPITARRASHWYVFRRTVRRYKFRFAVAAAMVLLALGSTIALSIMYGTQTRLLAQVEQERDRAKRRFDQVRKLAGSFIHGVHPRIANLQGATPARQYIVTTALEYLGSLAEEAGNDPGLLRELATAYECVGDVQGNPNQANLGDSAGALESYRESLRIARTLAKADPENPDYLQAVNIGLAKVGDMQRVLGQTNEALATYREALQIADQLVHIKPDHARYRQCLAINHDKLGDVQRDLSQLDQALANYRKSLTNREAAAHAEPDNAGLQRDLFISHIKVANIERDFGQTTQALAGYLKAAEIAELLARLRPNENSAQRDLSIIYSQIGYTEMQLGRTAEAVASHGRSVAIADALARSDPRDARAQRDLALGCNLLGEAQRKAKDNAAALMSFGLAREILSKLAAANAEDVYIQTDLASAYSQIGRILIEMGRVEEGMTICLQGHEIFISLAKAHPDNARHQRDLAESFYHVAGAHLQIATDAATSTAARAERWRTANSLLQQSHDAFVAMRAAGTFFESDTSLLASVETDLARCTAALAEQESPRRQTTGEAASEAPEIPGDDSDNR